MKICKDCNVEMLDNGVLINNNTKDFTHLFLKEFCKYRDIKLFEFFTVFNLINYKPN